MGVYINNKVIVKKQEEEQLKAENADLLFKQAMNEMEIEGIKGENADLIFRVALLEMGGLNV